MDKYHFNLKTRYRAILKNGKAVEIKLCPENCWYFYEQEKKYLIRAIREQKDLSIDEVERIEQYFVPVATTEDEEVEVVIGV